MADKIDNSPRGKIARGVKAAEAARKGRKPPALAHLIGQTANPENLHLLLNDCKSRLAKLIVVRDAASNALVNETAIVREHYDNEGYIISDSGSKEDILGGQRRRVLIEKAVTAAKKTIYGAIQDNVTELWLVEQTGSPFREADHRQGQNPSKRQPTAMHPSSHI